MSVALLVFQTSRLTSRRSQPPLALSVYREVAGWRISRAGGGSAFYVRQQDTTKHMNTTKILNLTKTLRALSMLFMSLSVLIIAIPLSSILGVHTCLLYTSPSPRDR